MKTLIEFFKFFKSRKQLWLYPFIILIVVLGMLLILIQDSALATLIYSFF